jgi:hypothetical protein
LDFGDIGEDHDGWHGTMGKEVGEARREGLEEGTMERERNAAAIASFVLVQQVVEQDALTHGEMGQRWTLKCK